MSAVLSTGLLDSHPHGSYQKFWLAFHGLLFRTNGAPGFCRTSPGFQVKSFSSVVLHPHGLFYISFLLWAYIEFSFCWPNTKTELPLWQVYLLAILPEIATTQCETKARHKETGLHICCAYNRAYILLRLFQRKHTFFFLPLEGIGQIFLAFIKAADGILCCGESLLLLF